MCADKRGCFSVRASSTVAYGKTLTVHCTYIIDNYTKTTFGYTELEVVKKAVAEVEQMRRRYQEQLSRSRCEG